VCTRSNECIDSPYYTYDAFLYFIRRLSHFGSEFCQYVSLIIFIIYYFVNTVHLIFYLQQGATHPAHVAGIRAAVRTHVMKREEELEKMLTDAEAKNEALEAREK
jgi:hypothetical protein